ncbi:MAG: hypothetical protein ACTSRP_02955 [Candidatus Helarchaeota archaeon]
MSYLEGPIKDLMFIKTGGVLLFSISRTKKGLETISSFLEAVKMFSQELDDLGELRSINLSKFSISYYCKNPKFYIIAIHDSDVPLVPLSNFFEKISRMFLEYYSEDLLRDWNHNISIFKPFINILNNEIENFSENCFIISEKGHCISIQKLSEELFKNNEIMAISRVSPASNTIQTIINNNLHDFSLQTFIFSPFYKKLIINIGAVLDEAGKKLLESEKTHYLIKTNKFVLGIRQKYSEYLGIIGLSYESIKNVISKIN